MGLSKDVASSLSMSLTTVMVVSVCIADSVTIAYDGSIMGSVNIMQSYSNYFQLNTATTAVNTTATGLGAILISPITGWLADWRGRKEIIAAGSILNIIGAAISGGAQNIAMFIAGRMIIGLGMGLAQTAAPAYVSETTAPRVRSFALGMYFTCWALGSVLATSVCYGTLSLDPSNWAWRIPCILQAAAPSTVLFLLPFLPESPRWLVYNDHNDEALSVLTRVNGATTSDDPSVQLQYQEIVDTLNFEKSAGRKLGIREVVRTSANVRRLLLALSVGAVTMLTGSNIITYYYGTMLEEAGITSDRTKMKIGIILSVWQLVVATTGTTFADRIGRRILCLSSLTVSTLMLYLVGGLTAGYGTGGNHSGIYGTVAAIFLFQGAYSFGLTPLTVMYPPEVLSYNIRATGMACFTLTVKAWSIFCTMAFPYMFDSLSWKAYMVNASWNVLFIVGVYLWWVETKGKTLEEIDELFDGEKHSEVPSLQVLEKKQTALVSEVEV